MAIAIYAVKVKKCTNQVVAVVKKGTQTSAALRMKIKQEPGNKWIKKQVLITPTGEQAVFISAEEACRTNADIYRFGLKAAGGAYKERQQKFCDYCGD